MTPISLIKSVALVLLTFIILFAIMFTIVSVMGIIIRVIYTIEFERPKKKLRWRK